MTYPTNNKAIGEINKFNMLHCNKGIGKQAFNFLFSKEDVTKKKLTSLSRALEKLLSRELNYTYSYAFISLFIKV